MNQRQFPASLNRFLTWLMLIAALVAVAVLLATPGVVWGQNPPIAKDTIPIQNLTVGTDLALDVSPFFEDVNNDLLTYSALSSDETVATVTVTVTVSSSMVTITPISIGTAIITVTADDGNDGTVGQTFNAVVQAAQAPPTAKDTITTQNLTVGTIGTLDVSPYFDDVNNDPLTYSALSSDDAIATVAINTNTATISPISDGTATITVTADDGNSGTGGRHCRPDFPSRSGQSTAHRRCRPGPKRG